MINEKHYTPAYLYFIQNNIKIKTQEFVDILLIDHK